MKGEGPNANLRIQFRKTKRCKKFYEFMLKDDILSQIPGHMEDKSILFEFKTIKAKEIIMNLILSNVPDAITKKTAAGYSYIKI